MFYAQKHIMQGFQILLRVKYYKLVVYPSYASCPVEFYILLCVLKHSLAILQNKRALPISPL